ncbi:MAG: aldehyde ferredoxin oxidoreductase family protein [Deltaproteobacteria bacterium]|nr:aldehyde ferredoxin oxidoreductase family protein [Deltaproteobacteria bacterium]
MNLYAGKVLMVDLTEKKISTEPLREEWLKDYWGCWGLALRYYWDLVSTDVDPLSPKNAIIIMTGPFCGTLVPMTSRFCLVSKSCQTGTVFESNTGGAFGPELKFAGYDGIIIKGQADSPTYLSIIDDKVSLENAEALTGKGIFETEKLLKEAVGSTQAKTLAIGPAGENLIGYACVGTESYRQMGRAGAGALFGSKKLKGIVCRGTGGIRVADMPAFLEKITHYKETNLFSEDNLWAKTDGTPILMDVTNEMGIHPTRNFTYGVNENIKSLNSDAIKAAKLGDRACASCPLACGKFTHINGAEMEGPEYETLCLGGSNCEINDLEQVIRFNRLCDDLGLDTISCGNTIGLAMDLTGKRRHDFGLEFGDPKEYLKVVSEIATLSTERGRDFAMGAQKMAEKYQAQDLVTQIKGLEFPAYEPRGNYGMGLAYATSERGACHMRAFTVFAEDPFDIEAMAREVIDGQNFNTIKWSMCFCDMWATITPEIMAELLSIGLGETVKPEQLVKSGEKIWNLSRLFNIRAGFTADDDVLPPKVMNQPLEKGPHAGKVFKEEDFEAAKRTYYQLRGWDEKGVPLQKKLAELGLE